MDKKDVPFEWLTDMMSGLFGRGQPAMPDVSTIQAENDNLRRQLEQANDDREAFLDEEQYLQKTLREIGDEKETAVTRVNELEVERDSLREHLSSATEDRRKAQMECHEQKKALQKEQTDSQKFKAQVMQYKKMISTSSRTEEQVADDVVREKVNKLFYDVHRFVFKTFKGKTIDFDMLSENLKAEVRVYVPYLHKLSKQYWLKVMASLIAQLMVSHFIPELFFGRTQEEPVASASTLAREALARNSSETKKWLIATRKLMTGHAEQALLSAERELAGDIAGHFYKIIRNTVSLTWTHETHNELATIFEHSQNLYRLLYSQDAHFSIAMLPAVINNKNQRFKADSMVEVDNSEDAAALQDRVLLMSVFPAICKKADGGETSGDGITYVAKGRVLLMPESSHDGSGRA